MLMIEPPPRATISRAEHLDALKRAEHVDLEGPQKHARVDVAERERPRLRARRRVDAGVVDQDVDLARASRRPPAWPAPDSRATPRRLRTPRIASGCVSEQLRHRLGDGTPGQVERGDLAPRPRATPATKGRRACRARRSPRPSCRRGGSDRSTVIRRSLLPATTGWPHPVADLSHGAEPAGRSVR